MKRIIILLLVVLVLALIFIYVFIPGEIKVARTMQAGANREALFRKLAEPLTWTEWWKGTSERQGKDIIYKTSEFEFLPGERKTLSIPLIIRSNSLETNAEFTLFSDQPDSTSLHIETVIKTPLNPIDKIRLYSKSKKLGKQFSEILESVATKYGTVSPVYGFDIQKKHVVDSNLVFTSATSTTSPNAELIYSLVGKLESYVKSKDASVTGYPMLNVSQVDHYSYLVKVALPVNKKLPDSGDIHYRWMLGGGNILITEVKGGPALINRAHEQIRHYISDHRRVAPAIHFESLVTDRRMEKDTNKWVTRIFYPVM